MFADALPRLRRWLHPADDGFVARQVASMRPDAASLRALAPLVFVLVTATLLCAVLGCLLALQIQGRQDIAGRQALLDAVNDYRAENGGKIVIDDRMLHILEHASGLKDLRWDAGQNDARREMQPVVENGRIIGWLSWSRDDRAAGVAQLWPLALLGLLCLGSFIGLCLWHVRRSGWAHVANRARMRALAIESRAGPPSVGVIRSLVMRALAKRSIQAAPREARSLEQDLRRAVAERMLQVEYQPIVSANGYRVVGVEALLRWQHASRGTIPPATFIPLAERSGLMDDLGDFVLRRALSDLKRWPAIYVAVNLSPLQLRDREHVERIAAALRGSGIEPQRVLLEITEGVLIEEPERIKSHLHTLRALGVGIALDDFGAGYSSLAYLRQLPIDKLKIDKGFVAPLGRSDNAGVIIQAMVALGRALGLSILVEGVESEEQRVLLRLAGCDEMQGFLFGRPSKPAEIDRLLAEADPSCARSASISA